MGEKGLGRRGGEKGRKEGREKGRKEGREKG